MLFFNCWVLSFVICDCLVWRIFLLGKGFNILNRDIVEIRVDKISKIYR